MVPDLETGGLVLALEPLETQYTNLVTSTREARDIADSVGSSAVGITLDTHFLRWEQEVRGLSIREAFEIAGGCLAHLHIQDDNRRAPGMGGWDFAPFLAAVGEIGWKGYLSLETFMAETLEEAEQVARRGIEYFRSLRHPSC